MNEDSLAACPVIVELTVRIDAIAEAPEWLVPSFLIACVCFGQERLAIGVCHEFDLFVGGGEADDADEHPNDNRWMIISEHFLL